MRIKAVVCYGEVKRHITIPCGDGKKSVKWLALVSAQRFAMDHAARGARRCRDAAMIVTAGTKLVPSGVETEFESFYHPTALVADCFVDSQEVRIKLEPKMRVGAAGQPRKSRWQIIAFSNSDAPARAQALEEEHKAREDLLKAQAEARQAAAADADKLSAGEMRKLIEMQLLSEEQINAVMDFEWATMLDSGCIEKWIRHKREQDKVRDILKEHFVALLELFRFYASSTSSMQDAHQLEYVEFCQFVRDIRLSEAKSNPGSNSDLIDHNLLASCFGEAKGAASGRAALKATGSNANGNASKMGNQTKGSLGLSSFFNALIWLAQFSKQTLRKSAASHPAAVRQSIQRRSIQSGMALTEANASSGFSTMLALQRLFQENIKHAMKLHHTQLIGTIAREHLCTDPILACYFRHYAELVDVYKTYLTSPPDPRHFDHCEGYMTLHDFQVLIEDSKLVGSKRADKHDELTLKECRQAFMGSQVELNVGGVQIKSPKKRSQSSKSLFKDKTNHANNVVGHQGSLASASSSANKPQTPSTPATDANVNQGQLLSFAEFTETLLRIALLKWDSDADGTTVDKLNKCLEFLVTNAHSAQKQRALAAETAKTTRRLGAASNESRRRNSKVTVQQVAPTRSRGSFDRGSSTRRKSSSFERGSSTAGTSLPSSAH